MLSGVIAEFDPFHNGHEYLLSRAKEDGEVAVCLSGSLTQRGTPCFMPKSLRAEAALAGGASLVFEMPSFFSCRSAEGFARAGVYILARAGVKRLVFGSECGDTEALRAAVTAEKSLGDEISKEVKTGLGYAAAREKALTAAGYFGEAAVLKNPNDILGCEYLKALDALAPDITAVAVKRETPREEQTERFASSSLIRSNPDGAERFMPDYSRSLLLGAVARGETADMQNASRLFLWLFRAAPPEMLSAFSEMSEGLEYRLKAAAERSVSLSEMLANAACKRYTDTRIIRAVTAAATGLNKSPRGTLPPYLRLLGSNAGGRTLLRGIKKSSGIPVITKSSDGLALTGFASEVFRHELRAADFRMLCTASCGVSGDDLRFTPVTR